MVKSLQESALKDILDTMEEIKNLDNISFLGKKNPGSMNVSSISRASKDLIMSFPVLCDNSIEPRTASMICKAVERKAVSMLQLIFASCSFEGISNGKDAIKQWHNNIDGGSLSLDDYLDMVEKFGESAEMLPDRQQRELYAMEKAVLEEHNNGAGKVYPTSSFSENSINDYMVIARYGNPVVMEARKGFIDKDQIDVWDTQRDYLQRQLMDSDIKKCNELVPSLMIVRYVTPQSTVCQFVAGVKARLIGVDGYDVAERINSKNKDRAGLVNLIRATTKEISFVKDYLLAIDKAKIDSKQNSIRNRSGRIWKTLEKRATKSVWKRMTSQTNDAAAITTLVVSQQLVNMIKKEYDIDLTNVKTASAIMDAYNLLCICIVDESIEVARFLYDGDDWFEDMSFDGLERETGDGSYKKVINLLTKMK